MAEAELIVEQAGTPLTEGPVTNDKIFELLFKEEDITWQSLLYKLVESHQMDPWDIDVSLLSKRFIEMIKKLKAMDFRISGKVVLAAAILLKMKSSKFLLEDITAFDTLLTSGDGEIGFLDDGDLSFMDDYAFTDDKKSILPALFPRTPQPRKRKVSIFDLVKALEKALEVKNRRVLRDENIPTLKPPVNHRDISLVIKDVFGQITSHFSSNNRLTFDQLLPAPASKEDKVMTFIPLLHLRTQQKIDLHQQVHFGEIEVELLKNIKSQGSGVSDSGKSQKAAAEV